MSVLQKRIKDNNLKYNFSLTDNISENLYIVWCNISKAQYPINVYLSYYNVYRASWNGYEEESKHTARKVARHFINIQQANKWVSEL